MLHSKISGVGHHVPENVVTNFDLEKKINTSDEWIRERTGIQERRFFTKGKDTVANMAAKAAKMALDRAGVKKEEIEMIIFATITSDYYFPGCGVLLQRELGLGNIPCMDIKNQCSGFIYALETADSFIKAGKYKTILVVGGEIQSSVLDYSDEGRAVSVIFGDGAGVVVLQATEEEDKGVLSTHLHSDGTYAEELAILDPGSSRPERLYSEMTNLDKTFCYMNGSMVFKHAVTKFPEVINEALDHNQKKVEDIDLLIPHQANLRISMAVGQRLGIADEKVYSNIQRYGNTTAASIPIAMSEAWEEGKLKGGDLLCLAAFGSGFTWASALIRW